VNVTPKNLPAAILTAQVMIEFAIVDCKLRFGSRRVRQIREGSIIHVRLGAADGLCGQNLLWSVRGGLEPNLLNEVLQIVRLAWVAACFYKRGLGSLRMSV
ncbi:hypothetical protein PIB30_032654, partial [Stylosanthes scabra]|nr:hypothetical protein [Stylosanthes scabra]